MVISGTYVLEFVLNCNFEIPKNTEQIQLVYGLKKKNQNPFSYLYSFCSLFFIISHLCLQPLILLVEPVIVVATSTCIFSISKSNST